MLQHVCLHLFACICGRSGQPLCSLQAACAGVQNVLMPVVPFTLGCMWAISIFQLLFIFQLDVHTSRTALFRQLGQLWHQSTCAWVCHPLTPQQSGSVGICIHYLCNI
jgi:hypothetical protein